MQHEFNIIRMLSESEQMFWNKQLAKNLKKWKRRQVKTLTGKSGTGRLVRKTH